MYYFRSNGSSYEKYSVTFDYVRLNELENLILENCCRVEHKEIESDSMPQSYGNYLILNLHSTAIGKVDYYDESATLYKFTYDKYTLSKLYNLVVRLSQGDLSSLIDIYNYNPSDDICDNDPTPYYIDLLNNIDIRLVDTLSISELNKISEFFGIDVITNDVKTYNNEYPTPERVRSKRNNN